MQSLPDPSEGATRRDRLTAARLSDRPRLCLGHVAMWQCQCTRHAKLERATVPTMCNGKQELCTILFIANVYARLKKLRTQIVIIIYYLYYIFLFVFLISSIYYIVAYLALEQLIKHSQVDSSWRGEAKTQLTIQRVAIPCKNSSAKV